MIKTNPQSGNVLWFILLAVALLAALTIVIGRSSSTVDQSGDVEQQTVKASQMLRYAKSIEAAVQEMRLRDVSENDISLWHDSDGNGTEDASDDNYNPGCTQTTCKIFNAGGAGLTYTPPPTGVSGSTDWLFVATNDVTGVGTTNTDLILILPDMRPSVCAHINRMLNVSYAGTESDVDFTPFTGTYTATEAIDLANGQEAGCIDYDTGAATEPFFYQVLHKR